MTLAVVVRCLTCQRIEFAKVVQADDARWPPAKWERMPVEDVRTAEWCGGHA